MACSTGKVICRSTSSGARAGRDGVDLHLTGVVSGKASMFRLYRENTAEAR